MYPLYTPLSTFDRFGTDVSQYMHFCYRATRVFLVLFLLNLSNIVINLEGGSLEEAGNIFTWHTLGNTAVDGVLAKGGHSVRAAVGRRGGSRPHGRGVDAAHTQVADVVPALPKLDADALVLHVTRQAGRAGTCVSWQHCSILQHSATQ